MKTKTAYILKTAAMMLLGVTIMATGDGIVFIAALMEKAHMDFARFDAAMGFVLCCIGLVAFTAAPRLAE